MSSAVLFHISLWQEYYQGLPYAALNTDARFESWCKSNLKGFQDELRYIDEECGTDDADIATSMQACIDALNAYLADVRPAYWFTRVARRIQVQSWIIEAQGLSSELTRRITQRDIAERRRKEQDRRDKSLYQKRAE